MKRKLNCILLIDDDEPTNFLNKMIIEEASCTNNVQVEQSATDALDFLTTEKTDPAPVCTPDLIFLDINMPAMDGWEFLEEYEKLTPDQKARVVVVMLTTSYNPEDEVKARNHEMIAAFRNKPLTPEMLMDVLQEYFPEKF